MVSKELRGKGEVFLRVRPKESVVCPGPANNMAVDYLCLKHSFGYWRVVQLILQIRWKQVSSLPCFPSSGLLLILYQISRKKNPCLLFQWPVFPSSGWNRLMRMQGVSDWCLRPCALPSECQNTEIWANDFLCFSFSSHWLPCTPVKRPFPDFPCTLVTYFFASLWSPEMSQSLPNLIRELSPISVFWVGNLTYASLGSSMMALRLPPTFLLSISGSCPSVWRLSVVPQCV